MMDTVWIVSDVGTDGGTYIKAVFATEVDAQELADLHNWDYEEWFLGDHSWKTQWACKVAGNGQPQPWHFAENGTVQTKARPNRMNTVGYGATEAEAVAQWEAAWATISPEDRKYQQTLAAGLENVAKHWLDTLLKPRMSIGEIDDTHGIDITTDR